MVPQRTPSHQHKPTQTSTDGMDQQNCKTKALITQGNVSTAGGPQQQVGTQHGQVGVNGNETYSDLGECFNVGHKYKMAH